jgi:hypothetical protein
MNLVAHQGMLFAGTSNLKDVPGNDPQVGAQVLRLDSPGSRWQVDLNLSEILDTGQPRYTRIPAMTSVTFTTDGQGQTLSTPVTMLLAAPADNTGLLAVYGRDDNTGAWTEMDVYQAATPLGFRAFGFHHDTVTGVDRVFAGAPVFGIFNGVYDPTVPGRIRWSRISQLVGRNRPMAFAETDGNFYLAVPPGLYHYLDGPLAHWELVYQYTNPPYLNDGLRGLTVVPNPSGEGNVLLSSLEGEQGYVGYVDPAAGYSATQEIYLVPYLLRQWGNLRRLYVVAAYNDMTVLQDPHTGEPLQLIGLAAQNRIPGQENLAWYLVRHLDGHYDLHEIPPIATPGNPDPNLFATRTIVVSPFAEDQGQVVYFGGYDVTWDDAIHNSAWIYRAPLDTVLGY